ncbi:TetR/AcrR family transcriptional regulator [Enterococcus olivae]
MEKVKTDRRILKSQAAIKASFIELLTESTFDKITIKDICEGANIGNRTFYLHYMDKFDLLEKLIEEHLEDLKEICRQKKALGIVEGSRIWFGYFQQNRDFFVTLFNGHATSSFRSQLLTIIVSDIGSKIDHQKIQQNGLTEDVYLRFLGMAIIGVIELYLENAESTDINDLADQVGKLVEQNLS